MGVGRCSYSEEEVDFSFVYLVFRFSFLGGRLSRRCFVTGVGGVEGFFGGLVRFLVLCGGC